MLGRATQHLRQVVSRRLRLELLEDRRMLATFTVSSLDDAGIDTLRQAILDANNLGGVDTIDFDQGLFGSPQSILLASALPTISESATITGPGPELLTLDAGSGTDNAVGTGDGFRIFDIDDGSSGNVLNVAIHGLTLTGGDAAGAGGAIRSRENLTLADTRVVANATGPGAAGSIGEAGQDGGHGGRDGDGGGIFSSGGDLTIFGSTIRGNSTGRGGNGGRGGDGGGIYSSVGELLITGSTLSGNTTGPGATGADGANGGLGASDGNGGDSGSGGSGGGIYSVEGSLTISHSTITGNRARGGGAGGISGPGGLPGSAGGDSNIGGVDSVVDIGSYEAQAPPSADFDQDNNVDGADFLAWQRGFGATSGALLASGNADDDEDVDASDLTVWLASFGTGQPALRTEFALSLPAIATQISAPLPVIDSTSASPLNIGSGELNMDGFEVPPSTSQRWRSSQRTKCRAQTLQSPEVDPENWTV